MAINGDYVEK